MKSIEERAQKVFLHCYDGLDERQSAYAQGAYEQLEIDVDTVWNLLCEGCRAAGVGNGENCVCNFKKELIRVMEGNR